MQQLVAQPTMSSQQQPINCCVIGYGMAGKGFHSYLISLNLKLKLYAIYVRNPDKNKQIRSDYSHVKIYNEWTDMLNDTAIQLCVIATPPASHVQQAIDCLKAKKHIVIDKPIVLNCNDIYTIQQHNIHNMSIFPFHQRRYDSDYLTVQKLIQSHELGTIEWIEMCYNKGISTKQWKLDTTENGGGRLWDLGPHMIDQFIQLYPNIPVKSVYARIVYSIPVAPHTDSYAQITVILQNNVTAVFDVNSVVSIECKPRFYIVGTHGTFVKYGQCAQESAMMAGNIDSATEPVESYGQLTYRKIPYEHSPKQTKTGTHTIPTERGNWKQFYNNVADVINGNAKQDITLESLIPTYAIIQAAILSAEENRVINFVDGKFQG